MDEQDYTLFEDYLFNTIRNWKRSFWNPFEHRPAFKERFNTYKELSAFLEHTFENEAASTDFKNNLKAISSKHFKKQQATKGIQFKPWQYAMAANIALLIGITLFNKLSHPVYADYANYDSISLTVEQWRWATENRRKRL